MRTSRGPVDRGQVHHAHAVQPRAPPAGPRRAGRPQARRRGRPARRAAPPRRGRSPEPDRRPGTVLCHSRAARPPARANDVEHAQGAVAGRVGAEAEARVQRRVHHRQRQEAQGGRALLAHQVGPEGPRDARGEPRCLAERRGWSRTPRRRAPASARSRGSGSAGSGSARRRPGPPRPAGRRARRPARRRPPRRRRRRAGPPRPRRPAPPRPGPRRSRSYTRRGVPSRGWAFRPIRKTVERTPRRQALSSRSGTLFHGSGPSAPRPARAARGGGRSRPGRGACAGGGGRCRASAATLHERGGGRRSPAPQGGDVALHRRGPPARAPRSARTSWPPAGAARTRSRSGTRSSSQRARRWKALATRSPGIGPSGVGRREEQGQVAASVHAPRPGRRRSPSKKAWAPRSAGIQSPDVGGIGGVDQVGLAAGPEPARRRAPRRGSPAPSGPGARRPGGRRPCAAAAQARRRRAMRE